MTTGTFGIYIIFPSGFWNIHVTNQVLDPRSGAGTVPDMDSGRDFRNCLNLLHSLNTILIAPFAPGGEAVTPKFTKDIGTPAVLT